MKTVLAIDADVLVYIAAASNQQNILWPNGAESVALDFETAKRKLHEEVDKLVDVLKTDKVVMCLSHPVNFRKKILPTYKNNRHNKEKPLLIPELQKYVKQHFYTMQHENLEGDDCCALIATTPLDGVKIISVTIDKDFRGVPGFLYFMHKPELGVIEVLPEEADRFHMYQTLIGDPTDGYAGCPNIGDDKATQFLNTPYCMVPYEYTFSRGARKGETEIRWEKQEPEGRSLWQCIVSLYQSKGLTEEDALIQAQVARILRYEEYDYAAKEVKLWSPDP